ncbi:curlin [Bradyrhizobium iriomotense]|uniref:curlin n=1 Tax=Bradyrhizobium iriomotense TaxID=441950 RepID=UPI0032AF6F91
MKWSLQASIFAALLASAIGGSSAASAGSVKSSLTTSALNIETVFAFGNDPGPVQVNESSQFNFARVIELGGASPVGATIIQTGTQNYASVYQTGSTTSAAIGQFGASNTTNVMQMGNANNTLLVQVGDMNTGAVSQSGRFNWAAIFQFGR